jgi:tetratricopeptide (TPR) repeat protein
VIRLPKLGASLAVMTLSISATLAPFTVLAAAALATANADLQAGKADEAMSLLNQAIHSDPNDAEANNLLCRVQYATQHFDKAAGPCEKAVSLSPQNARYRLWLGRVTGERASRAAFMSAFSLAKKSREQFETAVKLDPRDAEALSDLGEFYKEAPGVVGGGMDKAEEIAKKLDALDASRAHELRAQMAEKQKDMGTAERELKAACTGSRAAIQWMQLASFYRRQERWTEMEAAVKSGEAAAAHDRREAVAFFNGASVLARANRQPQEAIKLYERYIDSADKTEEAPAFDVLARLAKLRKQTGDQAGAERDRAAALALAHDYKPALDALQDAKH